MGILSKVLDLFKPLTDLVDELHTSTEEKVQAKAALARVQAELLAQLIAFETERISQQAAVIQAEAKSDLWITKAWRPITMLTLLALLVLHWFGVGPQPLPEDLWSIMKIGLGGYIGGRSLEKIAGIASGAVKEMKKE